MMRKYLIFLIFMILPLLLSAQSDSLYLHGIQKHWNEAQVQDYLKWEKVHFAQADGTIRQYNYMNGNLIYTEIWNFGSISSPGNRITDIIWNGLGYGYEFGPFVAAEVRVPQGSHEDAQLKRDAFGQVVLDEQGDSVWVAHVISDGLKSNGGELSSDGLSRWGWQPMVQSDDGINQFLNLDSRFIPTSDDKDTDGDGKPDTWPNGWYNETLRKYVWPGALGQGATNADKEAFFVMDDRDNLEFRYDPYPSDNVRGGLGLEVESRYYQWSNSDAEDAIFLIYKIKNKGNQDLEKVIFGMWGDPHIGGPADYADDLSDYDSQLEMTFAYDANNYSINNPSIKPGYLGYKFLESPGLANDHKDNDEDGMVDESWTDGLDNDNDWNIDTDDIGIDGVAGTGDQGEDDGQPTAGDPFDLKKPGEPNFEFTDIDESDMIGLTSFQHPAFAGLRISDDEYVWRELIQPGDFDSTSSAGDNVFLYASGRFTLKSIFNVAETEISESIKRLSIALILGADRNDLILNARTVQRIYNSNYQYTKPPAKPNLTLVPGDRKVTLYWDDVAESSVDPISKKQDFEGYVIYRSTNYQFLDQQTITDAYGVPFLFEPLETEKGAEARFDLINGISGFARIPFQERGVSYYLGNDTGLRHTFIDSNAVLNGQTYYYAVISYDHGDDSLGTAPSECSKIITYFQATNEYSFDVNTGSVIPRSRAAGYTVPEIADAGNESGVLREVGYSTGNFALDIIDELRVEEDNKFDIEFTDTSGVTEFSVLDTKEKSAVFTSFFENYVPVPDNHLKGNSVLVSSTDGQQLYQWGLDFDLDTLGGSVKVFDPAVHSGARMADAQNYLIRYTNYPVFRSTKVDSELSNPIFDGLRLIIKESTFELNKSLTGWSASSRDDLTYNIAPYQSKVDLFDYEIQFFDEVVDTVLPNVQVNFKILDVINQEYMTVYVTEATGFKNNRWELISNKFETIFILRGGTKATNAVWQIQLSSSTGVVTLPGANDKLYLATDKPFSNGDRFSFTTKAAKVDQALAKNQLDRVRVVPNPYVATNVIEPANRVSTSERGYRRLYFDKLPAVCAIRIYTQAGELVRVLEHNSAIDDGKEFWDLLTKDNMEVAYGLYFFQVDAPGIGQKIGKFAIIK